MGYGIRLKKPAYTKDTNLYDLERLPGVLIPVGEEHTVTVAKGDRVLAGQILGVSLGRHTPIHSSVSGKVKDIVNIGGREYIKIENDAKFELSPDVKPCEKRLSQMTTEEMTERIRLCGIDEWKLLSERAGKVRRFAVNCLDADPYRSDRKCAIRQSAKEIIGGAKIALKILGLRLCEFVIERKNTASINDLIDSIGNSSLFDIIETDGRYPSGDNDRIITLLPHARGMNEEELCVLDVHALCAIYRAFAYGTPYTYRIVSVGGDAAITGGCYKVPVGTPVKYVAAQIAELDNKAEASMCVIKGGMMSGFLLSETTEVVDKDTHSLTFTKKKSLTMRAGTCIGCGKCDAVCPDGLLPSLFMEKCEKNYNDALVSSGMDCCTGCGACSYVCPANLPITEIAEGHTDPKKKNRKRSLTRAPFIHHSETLTTFNLDFTIVMLVLLGFAFCCFGIRALMIAAVAVVTAVIADLCYSALVKTGPASPLNLNSVVCAMICALSMSVQAPLYLPAITAFFAVVLVRGAFGGYGKNIIHAAFCARIFTSLLWHDVFVYDAEIKYTLFDHLIGNTEGALGEISVILLAACALYLIIRRVITLTIPIAALSTFAVTTFLVAPEGIAPETVQLKLASTAIVFVSIFCHTEPSTLPRTSTAKMVYGCILGAIAALICNFTSYEGAYIAAVAASALAPVFNRMRRARPYGSKNRETTEQESEEGTDTPEAPDDPDAEGEDQSPNSSPLSTSEEVTDISEQSADDIPSENYIDSTYGIADDSLRKTGVFHSLISDDESEDDPTGTEDADEVIRHLSEKLRYFDDPEIGTEVPDPAEQAPEADNADSAQEGSPADN